MRSLAGVELPINTDWVDRHTASPVRQTKRYTTGGRLVVATQRLLGNNGQPITLEWRKGRAWLPHQFNQFIITLTADVNATYPFVWDTEQHTVAIDYERGGRDVAQRGWRLDESIDKFFGQLFLYKV